jgi:laminin, alpha 3/5
VIKNGECIPSTFRTAPDSRKTEFELDNEDKISEIKPINIHDNSTKLIYLDHNTAKIEIK